MSVQVALLRGVNVGGNRKVAMAELRAALAAAGFGAVRSYIASGNLLFESEASPAENAARIAALVAARFGFPVDVVARDLAALQACASANPLPDAARERPRLLHLLLAQGPIPPDAAETVQARAAHGEVVSAGGGALWIDFAGGAAVSKLTPAVITRAAGAPVTARNWLTVQALLALAA